MFVVGIAEPTKLPGPAFAALPAVVVAPRNHAEPEAVPVAEHKAAPPAALLRPSVAPHIPCSAELARSSRTLQYHPAHLPSELVEV